MSVGTNHLQKTTVYKLILQLAQWPNKASIGLATFAAK